MSELEQTIEELEAEVLAELEEASDPQTKGAAPAEGKKKIGNETPGGEVEDGGEPVVEPDAKKSPTDVAAKKAKEVKSDAQQKGAGKADKPEKLAAGDQVEPEEGQEEIAEAKKMTKAQALEQIGKMKKSDIEEMMATHAGKLSEAENAQTEEELAKLEDAKAEIEEKIKSISVKEDVAALVEGEGLSEEFKNKAATIFEAAVKSKTREEITRIHDTMTSEFDEKLEESVNTLTEKVDTYLNYVVEEWTKENELAIERGLKGEIAEDFISGLKQLFEDHYIDVPNEKYDVLEAQSDKISELEEKINSVMEQNVSLTQVKSQLVREQVISEVSEELTDTEIEKFKSLTEDVDFVSEESFRAKLNTLKESYFPKTVVEQSFNDEEDGTAQDIDTTGAMTAYMSAISRNKKRAQ
jgi:uncharacterized protein (DUF2267 family)